MEKYRQMGLSEDEAKIHLKREKRAEKVEKERRLQIEAEAGFQIAIKNLDFGVGSKVADFSLKVSDLTTILRDESTGFARLPSTFKCIQIWLQTAIWKLLKDKRKAEILSKIINEEKDLERRKIQNPTLFMTNEHLLPRPSDTLGQFSPLI